MECNYNHCKMPASSHTADKLNENNNSNREHICSICYSVEYLMKKFSPHILWISVFSAFYIDITYYQFLPENIILSFITIFAIGFITMGATLFIYVLLAYILTYKDRTKVRNILDKIQTKQYQSNLSDF